ncbi:MAG TPA: sigma-70 family RNA polymerase sigma factor [Polyangiaceae bacterium]|nr:sigma-70 family RNA polymerase sigma factor [Polyangiaceae bacterium]
MTESRRFSQVQGEVTASSSVQWVAEQAIPEAPICPAFQEIFRDHLGYVWHALRRLGVHDRDLEDVAHDVFLAVLKKLDQYDTRRPLRPWLFGFAFRFASDYRDLARHRYEVTHDGHEPPDHGPSALDDAIQSEALRVAQRALGELELGRRAVFILHELDECTMPEVAEALGIPLNTAYSRLRLARADLATQVRRLRSKGEP